MDWSPENTPELGGTPGMDWSPENTPELGGSGEGEGSGKGGGSKGSEEPLKHSITRGQQGEGSKGSEEEAWACTGALKTLHHYRAAGMDWSTPEQGAAGRAGGAGRAGAARAARRRALQN